MTEIKNLPEPVVREGRALARQLRSLVRLADFLDEVGSIEDLTRQHQEQEQQSHEQLQQVQAQLGAANGELASIRNEIHSANTQKARAIEESDALSVDVRNKAHADAAKIVEEAQNSAKKILADSADLVRAQQAEVNHLTAKRDTLKTQVQDLQQELARIRAKLG